MSIEAITPSNWTDPRIDALKRMWAEGMSCNEIAAALGGVSRNAVIGKIHRCGFQAPADKVVQNTGRPKRQPGFHAVQWRPPMSREERSRRMKEREALKLLTQPEPLPVMPVRPDFLNLTFDQLQRGDCRWAIGDEAPFVFCGNPTVDGTSWCSHCYGVTHKMGT